ncbi:MAG: S8 family serine peptidase, partial [Chloroflexi bacterium]|nr:S8 family serine peptidase [Chloroflexota bacterium]
MITRRVLFSMAIVIILALALSGQAMAGPGTDQVPERKIVVFKTEFRNLHEQEAILARFGSPSKALPIVNGWAVAISPVLQARLGQLREVARIDDDVEVYALPDVGGTAVKPAATQLAETLPWGVDRIDAELAWATSRGASVKVAIIDTGIDLSHPDLKANIKGGYNAVIPTKSPNDD